MRDFIVFLNLLISTEGNFIFRGRSSQCSPCIKSKSLKFSETIGTKKAYLWRIQFFRQNKTTNVF